jgi:hypothetical protein
MVCRTARAAMWALRKSGVKFRTRANDDGTFERWQSPKLPAWEVPKRNPHERRPRAPDWRPEVVAADPTQQLPQAPDVAARRRAERRRWRVRQRARAAQRAATAPYEGARTPDGPALAATRKTAG